MNMAQTHPFGSARFALNCEIRRAFRARYGVPIGFFKGHKIYHSKNAGALLFGGAGSGKFTTVFAHNMIAPGRNGEPQRTIVFCPKNEFSHVIGWGLAQGQGAHLYVVAPYGADGHTTHSVDLLAHIRPDSATLIADAKRVAINLLPDNPDSENRFFDQTGQNWLAALIVGLVFLEGSVSYQSLYRLIMLVRSHPEAWLELAAQMADRGPLHLEEIFKSMITMAAESQRTFDSVYTSITNSVAWMQDPAMQSALPSSAEADFTLDVLTAPSDVPVYVVVSVPPDLIAQNAAFVKQFFSTARTLKQRNPLAPTINFLMDECSALGRFEEIEEFFSIGRGLGISPFCCFQSTGQVTKNLGQTGAAILSASADVEIYLGGGISDLQTAEQLSRKLGQQTLVLDDPLTQARAAKAKREVVHAMLFDGADPIKTGITMQHLDFEMAHTRKQARWLMSPDEILNMPQDKALILPSSYGIYPLLADKEPYYQRREYAGLHFPNPHFGRSMDTVSVMTRWGRRDRAVIEEPVPERYANFPQYRDGTWRFIEGYRPKT